MLFFLHLTFKFLYIQWIFVYKSETTLKILHKYVKLKCCSKSKKKKKKNDLTNVNSEKRFFFLLKLFC